jgi:hypothetical protein
VAELRKYGVTLDLATAGSLRIRMPLRKAGSSDFATGSDWTPATGDVKVTKDGGAQANIGALPAFSNGSWEFTLSNTELSAKLVEVRIVDAATKAVDDDGFNIETFGHASAMYPTNYAGGGAGNMLSSGVGTDQISTLNGWTYAMRVHAPYGKIINAVTGTSYTVFETATNAAGAGDQLLLGAGSFTQTARATPAQYVSIVGPGSDLAIINTSASTGGTNTSLTLATGVHLEGFSYLSTVTNAFLYLLGATENEPSFSFATLKGMRLSGGTDVFWTDFASTFYLTDCRVESQWDVTAGGTYIWRDVGWVVRGPSSVTGFAAHGPSAAGSGFGGFIDVRDGGTGGTTGISGADVFLAGVPIYSSSATGPAAVDVKAANGQKVRLANCAFDHTRTSTSGTGAITIIEPPAAPDFNNVRQATSPVTLTNITVPTATNVTNGVTGGSLIITPFQAVTTNPRYSTRDLPPIAQGSAPTEIWTITDGTGTPVNLSGKTIRLVAYLETEVGDTEDTFDNTLTPKFKYETGGSGITIGGASNNQVTVQHDAAKTATPGHYRYWIWDTTSNVPLAKGRMPIEPAVSNT